MARFFATTPGAINDTHILLVSSDGTHFTQAGWIGANDLLTADEIVRALLAAEAEKATGSDA